MALRRTLVAVLVTAPVVIAPRAGGQSPPPPCSTQAADQPTIDVVDLDEAKSSTLVATHSLQVSVDFFAPTAFVDDSSVSVSAAGLTGASPLTFSTDTPGPLPISVSWTQDDGTGRGSCSASATSTVQLQAPAPIPRFKSLLTHQVVRMRYTLGWSIGAFLKGTEDHRPVTVRYRGWRRARLPDSSVPFRTLTAPIRKGDPGFGSEIHKLALPRVEATVTAGPDIVAVKLSSVTTTRHARPVAYDIWLTQADRTLARFRLAGSCSAFNCNMRTVKVQR